MIKKLEDPYEIEQYFDTVERSKGAAILKMLANEINESEFFNSLIVNFYSILFKI